MPQKKPVFSPALRDRLSGGGHATGTSAALWSLCGGHNAETQGEGGLIL